jgi:hypothetical protein
MQTAVRQKLSPVWTGFEVLRNHPLTSASYRSRGFGEEIGRNPSVNFPAFDQDCNAAYQCALMAAITSDKHFAATARTIMLGWSASLKRVSGMDAVLMAGIAPFKLANAAELLRSIGELNGSEVRLCQHMLKQAILPTILDFAPFANGNWDTAAIKTMMAIAVFCDDRALFERAVLYYLYGDGDGRLTHYIYSNGQCQESGRDQQHTQLGLTHMADACEVAWHQGLDLYGAENNLLLRGFEYTAAYLVGDNVVFNPDIDRTGKYQHAVISPRSEMRPNFEQVLAHYHVRRGLPAPALERAVKRVRPENAGHSADQTGFGTLLYAGGYAESNSTEDPASPVALHAEASSAGIALKWLQPRGNPDYSIERAGADGIFRKIQTGVKEARFLDATPSPGKLYSYRVIANNLSSPVTSVCFGLPGGWKEAELGTPAVRGSSQFDGNVLTINAGGAGLMRPADEGHFVYATGKQRILEARFVPQTASQFVSFGAMYRESLQPDASSVALFVSPGKGELEHSGWIVRLKKRESDHTVQTLSEQLLAYQDVDYGRLLRPVWFRMHWEHSRIIAAYSMDGRHWTSAGEVSVSDEGYLGLAAGSGIAQVDAAVRFDSITLS